MRNVKVLTSCTHLRQVVLLISCYRIMSSEETAKETTKVTQTYEILLPVGMTSNERTVSSYFNTGLAKYTSVFQETINST